MSAVWGGPGAATASTQVEVRCHRCGGFTGLRYTRDGFECRDSKQCARNLVIGPIVERALAEYLAATRAS